MEIIVQFWLDMKVLYNLIASAILVLIWKYLKNKPLEMQTLFDSMIKDYILIVFANFISSNLIFIKFKDEYSHEIAMTLIKIQTCVAVAMFLQIFIALIIRYMSIFHQGYLNDFKDSVIVFISRIFVGISAVVISILEDSGEGGAQYSDKILLSQIYLKIWWEALVTISYILSLPTGPTKLFQCYITLFSYLVIIFIDFIRKKFGLFHFFHHLKIWK